MGRNNTDLQIGAGNKPVDPQRPTHATAAHIVKHFRLWDAEAFGLKNKTFMQAKIDTVESPTIEHHVRGEYYDRPNPQAGLSEDVRKNGVKTPLTAYISENGKPMLDGGHSRLAIMYKYNPNTPIPIHWWDAH